MLLKFYVYTILCFCKYYVLEANMKYLLIAFKNKNSLYSFTKFLKLKGINFSTINTPRKISSSCGLSVKTSYQNFNSIKQIITSYNNGILGVFIVEQIGLQENFQRIF